MTSVGSSFAPEAGTIGNPDYDNAPKLIKELWDKYPHLTTRELIDVFIKLYSEVPIENGLSWADSVIDRYESEKRKARQDMILRYLREEGNKTVVFTKTDGSTRVMNCTLTPELLPVVTFNEKTVKKARNPDVCAVYDTDTNQWRSFRWDSLIMVTFRSQVVYKKDV